ncbi:MAG: hypothetical protein LBU32_03755 [Clostridiales bacterium]|nr:hypothetical protein [Clostridiales bacterium]
MDIMDTARQAEEGAARKAGEGAARKAGEGVADFACRDIMHWRYERRKLKAARKLLKEKGLPTAGRCRLKCWISAYAAPPPGFIGMLSIQEGGLRAPLVEYKGKAAEILPEEDFLEHAGMKPADSARNRGRPPFDRPVRTAVSLARTSISAKIRRIFAGEGADLEAARQSFREAGAKIKREAFELLFDAAVESGCSGYFQTWHGYRVSAIDAEIDPLSTDERTMAERRLDSLSEKGRSARELIIFDRALRRTFQHFCAACPK